MLLHYLFVQGNIVSSLAADSIDDNVGFRSAKALEANDPTEKIQPAEVQPAGAPQNRGSALQHS
jgi:hypothetical protein